ncbi:MAG: hypothetical protein KC996_11995 [Phycisphaerales bacterium]|nr:hypothetical protein [Phycisphaerales bacterium]
MTPAQPTLPGLEGRISATGQQLRDGLNRVIDQVPGGDSGPQRLAKELGIDKVLASRILKALRATDPMSVIHRVPGPEPMRRLLKASGKLGVDTADIASALAAVDQYESLIRTEIGDRSALEAILSAWVPEARREFELRRKQAAFRAMSQLKGCQAEVYAEVAIFSPNEDGETIDIVWIKAVIGLQRLRPGVRVKFTSRRQVEDQIGRRTYALCGDPVDGVSSTTLPGYCSTPTPVLDAQPAGEMMHYLLKEDSFGANSSVDLVTCEVNRGEIARYIPGNRNRKAWASSDLNIPSQKMHFDVLVHRDLYNQAFPMLRVYDTTINGQADINDPTRDIDQFDLLENIEGLGEGLGRFGSSCVPRYRAMLDEVCRTLGFDGDALRGYRCTSDYPIYGSQYAMVFPTQERPGN